MKDVVIIGGGLAGLVNALQLARAGFDVLLIEKNTYPFHKVCGEYISNEVTPFLQSIDAYPEALKPPQITQFLLTSNSGRAVAMALDLGGFGISRYAFDHFLYERAKAAGAAFLLNTKVENVEFKEDEFEISLANGEKIDAGLVIGAHGKRAKLDKKLNRKFIQERSPYIGIKYHIKYDFPENQIALHNFSGGYCGICAIENKKVNFCYLSTRDNLKKFGKIEKMEQELLGQNPYLKKAFSQAEFLTKKPQVINEISFAPKEAIVNRMLMCGDAAGLITPLCGNGMAMAIHSAKVLSDLIVRYYDKKTFDREKLENEYARQWKDLFAQRLRIGRMTQKLFGNAFTSDLTVALAKNIKPLASYLIRQTHGQPFV